jgi:bacillithiol biosynthesis deacetylase BshB1
VGEGYEPVWEIAFPGALAPERAFPLDLCCVAPHPDDAELGMGGTLALHAGRGARVGVLDLSRGEMASNGTPAERLTESAAAAAILGLCWRGNLGLPDRGLTGPTAVARLAAAIRWLRPALLFIPSPEDPHPDHRAAYHLAVEAVFSAGLRRFVASAPGAPEAPAHRPHALLQYCINGWTEPTLAVDVSAVYVSKRQAVAAHRTQFGSGRTGSAAEPPVPTRLNEGRAMAQVEGRERFLGARIGVAWAEGFVPEGPLRVGDLNLLRGVSG